MTPANTPAGWTGGPWAVSKNSSGRRVTSTTGVMICNAILRNTGRSRTDLKHGAKETAEAEANARLIAAAPDLYEALRWALPLAERTMDDHRLGRVKAGHSDIHGTYKNGVTWAGIYQSEVDEIESARAALNKALGK